MVPKLTPKTMYNDIILNIGYNLTYHPLRLIFFIEQYGNSALSEACFVGRAYIVQRLLSRGAHFVQDPIQLRPNSPKISVLQRAINQGFEEIVGLLLSSGLTGDVNMVCAF